METNSWESLAFVAAFLLACLGVLLFIVTRVVRGARLVERYGGQAGALYEARVVHTYGALDAARQGRVERAVKVVGLDVERGAVGLEIHRKAAGLSHVRAVRLTPDEALRLAVALESEAAR